MRITIQSETLSVPCSANRDYQIEYLFIDKYINIIFAFLGYLSIFLSLYLDKALSLYLDKPRTVDENDVTYFPSSSLLPFFPSSPSSGVLSS